MPSAWLAEPEVPNAGPAPRLLSIGRLRSTRARIGSCDAIDRENVGHIRGSANDVDDGGDDDDGWNADDEFEVDGCDRSRQAFSRLQLVGLVELTPLLSLRLESVANLCVARQLRLPD